MAGLFLVQARDRAFAQSALAGAREQFELHGFSDLSERQLPGWHLLHAPHIIGGPESLLIQGDDLVAVAGTFTCDGKMGLPALQALLAMTSAPGPDWSRIGGHFVALVHKAGRSFLFTDYFGAFQLFHDRELRFFSTSLLSATRAVPRLSFDPQGVYEFAFNVVPIGDDTIFSELKMLGPNCVAELSQTGAMLHRVAKPLPDRVVHMPLKERIQQHRERLGAVVRQHIAAFGDNIFCALSGGFDSRLVFAALRAEGSRPRLFVYGGPESEDVQIALGIGKALGYEVDWLDKEAYRFVEPDEFREQVECNFHQFDALPNFGELFENGGNAAGRDARHKDGALSASGGCGEIFRNFFFLPNRRLPASAVSRTFFARYAPGDVTDAFDENAFLREIEDKILSALGMPGDRSPLPRNLVEQIYPRVRCRSAFGKEISLEGRYGAYLMPFLDHHVVSEAMTLPIGMKNAGKFEAELINAIDPELARQPSAYGFDLTGPPSFKHRLSEWSTRIRPVWLRRRSYALQRRIRPMADEHGGLLSGEYMSRVVDLEYPAMRRFFRPEQITDSSVMRRIACLEYFAAYLGSKLTDPS